MLTQDYPVNKEQAAIFALTHLLCKLNVAGIKKRHVTLAASMLGRKPGKYVFRMAIVTTAVEYLVLVPWRDCDEYFKRFYV